MRGMGFYEEPTFPNACIWLTEKHNLFSYLFMNDPVKKTYIYHIEFIVDGNRDVNSPEKAPEPFIPGNSFETYENAELACLIKMIEIAKNAKK